MIVSLNGTGPPDSSNLCRCRETSERELKEVRMELVERLDRIQAAVRVEQRVRREEDEKIDKKFKAEVVEIESVIRAETVAREDDVRLVRGRLDVLEHQEIKAAERAQLQIFEQVRQPFPVVSFLLCRLQHQPSYSCVNCGVCCSWRRRRALKVKRRSQMC